MMKTFRKDTGLEVSRGSYNPIPDPVSIGHDVWIGENVKISPGVNIGDGAVVASNSVVTKDVESYSIVGGVPATHRKYRFPLEITAELRRCQWWQYDPSIVSQLPIANPAKFAEEVRAGALQGAPKYYPEVLTASDLDQFRV